MGQPVRSVPDDFMQLAPGKKQKWLTRHYSAGLSTVLRWLDEAGLFEGRMLYAKLPDNIDVLAQTMCLHEIGKAICWHKDIVSKRLKLLRPDIYEKARANGQAKAKAGRMKGQAANNARAAERRAAKAAAKPKAAPRKRMSLAASGRAPMAPQADARTDADKAMRYLQRFGACFPMRVHNPVLDDYSFRGIRMTGAALIAEARKRGWSPDAWRALAA